MATVDWETVGVWVGIILAYVILSFLGLILFPPMVICLFLTEGDLDTCSFGIWNTGYKDRGVKCHERDWYEELTDDQAECYLGNYADLREKFVDDICNAKIHWESYGMFEGRSYQCGDSEVFATY